MKLTFRSNVSDYKPLLCVFSDGDDLWVSASIGNRYGDPLFGADVNLGPVPAPNEPWQGWRARFLDRFAR